MPITILHIDQIARQKLRDVLLIEFGREMTDEYMDYLTLPVRQEIIDWLDAEEISWSPCGHLASENYMEAYRGQIYVDVPFDLQNMDCKKLIGYFENSDGTMRMPDVTLCCLPLSWTLRIFGIPVVVPSH